MSEALRLADLVEHDPLAYSDDAAAELRRLSAELEKVREDAQNRMYLLQRVRDFPENVTHKGSLLWADILRELSRAAMKGTP